MNLSTQQQKMNTWLHSHKLLCLYLCIIHIAIISLILKPSLAKKLSYFLGMNPTNTSVSYNYNSMKTMLSRIDKNTKGNRIIFIGDSLIQGLAVNSIHPDAINFGIGRDTINGVLERGLTYQSIRSAAAVIISVGINDLRYNSVEKTLADYTLMLKKFPHKQHLYLHTVLPIDSIILDINLQQKITLFNQNLFKLTSKFANIHILKYPIKLINSKGDLRKSLHLGDGLHLNPKGYDVWINQLKLQLEAHE